MVKRELAEGITLYKIQDSKFKDFCTAIFFTLPLRKETAAKTALLAKVLSSGTEMFPNIREINLYLERMYGASFNASTEKHGENQVIAIKLDVLSEKYCAGIMHMVKTFIEQILFCPAKESGVFKKSIVDRQKLAQKEEIEGIINDKRKYALLRCIEEMCSGEAYGVRINGTVEETMAVTCEELYKYYNEVLNTAKIDIFVSGDFNPSDIDMCFAGTASKLGPRKAGIQKSEKKNTVQKVKYITDKEDVLQGKLVLGYRLGGSEYGSPYALKVFNSVFGEGTSSKLFNNVREKMSLCYYASSKLEMNKGLMLVQSGIEFSDYEKALNEIIKQAEEIKTGNISEEEFSGAVEGLVNHLRSYKDNTEAIINYYYSNLLLGIDDGIDRAVEGIKAVTPEDVIEVAESIALDTVYFLNGKEDGNE